MRTDMQLVSLICLFLLLCVHAGAQKRWNGPATGNWDNPQNWQPAGIPAVADDVTMDNTNQKDNIRITLPDATVNIHSLLIAPLDGVNIELIIPASNKSSPALVVTDPGNSVSIRNGGILRNASGLSSGQSIQLAGAITILTGGRYIHNSRSSHATEIVARLSVVPGTEQGIFEFDVPGGSYPISVSNRRYGTLILSSDASGGVQTYNASGSNEVILNGDFQINNGVQFNLDLTKDFIISGNYVQTGGVFNLASQPNNNIVKVKGNASQSPASVLTESSGGSPVLEFSGTGRQQVSFAGTITNSVSLRIDNPAGIALTSPLTLPYRLELLTGAIKTGETNSLIIADNCVVSGGSANSFIDGPIKKIGDDDFEFPVGKQGDYAPIKISGSGGMLSDVYTAEYFLGSPRQAYGYAFETPPVIRISNLEYWKLERSSGNSIKKISVYVGNYSNATALESLTVVRWDPEANRWKNEGNSSYSGVAVGTVVSRELSLFTVFTLGSTVELQNPLLLQTNGKTVIPPVAKSQYRIVTNKFLIALAGNRERLRVLVTDVQGRQVMIFEVDVNKGSNKIPLPLDQLARGSYFVNLYDGRGRWLLVQKISKLF